MKKTEDKSRHPKWSMAYMREVNSKKNKLEERALKLVSPKKIKMPEQKENSLELQITTLLVLMSRQILNAKGDQLAKLQAAVSMLNSAFLASDTRNKRRLMNMARRIFQNAQRTNEAKNSKTKKLRDRLL